MTTAIDTNVLFDLRLRDPKFGPTSRRALDESVHAGPVVVCPVVYAELAASFEDPAELDVFLHDLTIRVDPFDPAALWQAGQAWRVYTRHRGQHVQCAHCGCTFGVSCPHCRAAVAWRQHLITDFLIGAHALVQADQLLTRDRGYYETYFPRLSLKVPVPADASLRSE